MIKEKTDDTRAEPCVCEGERGHVPVEEESENEMVRVETFGVEDGLKRGEAKKEEGEGQRERNKRRPVVLYSVET